MVGTRSVVAMHLAVIVPIVMVAAGERLWWWVACIVTASLISREIGCACLISQVMMEGSRALASLSTVWRLRYMRHGHQRQLGFLLSSESYWHLQMWWFSHQQNDRAPFLTLMTTPLACLTPLLLGVLMVMCATRELLCGLLEMAQILIWSELASKPSWVCWEGWQPLPTTTQPTSRCRWWLKRHQYVITRECL